MKNSNTTTPTMEATTLTILNVADLIVPGGRAAFLADIAPLTAAQKFFTTGDVAKRYRVSILTVKEWRQGGRLVSTLRSRELYALADLQRFENEVGTMTLARS